VNSPKLLIALALTAVVITASSSSKRADLCVDLPPAAPAAVSSTALPRSAVAEPVEQLEAAEQIVPATWIEAGTPLEYQRPYLQAFVPVAIHRDGRQVYEGVPMTVRGPDGSLRSVPTRVELEPAVAAPVHPSELGAAVR